MNKSESFFKLNIATIKEIGFLNSTDIHIYSTLHHLNVFKEDIITTNLDILHRKAHSTPITKEGLIKYKASLIELRTFGLIEIDISLEEIKKINKNTVINIKVKKEDPLIFAKIYREDFDKILKLDLRADIKSKLVAYYINIISTINSKTLVGWTSTKKLAAMSDINIKTLYKFNQILSEIKVLYIKTHLPYSNNYAEIERDTNTYARYRDKGKIKNNDRKPSKDKSINVNEDDFGFLYEA